MRVEDGLQSCVEIKENLGWCLSSRMFCHFGASGGGNKRRFFSPPFGNVKVNALFFRIPQT